MQQIEVVKSKDQQPIATISSTMFSTLEQGDKLIIYGTEFKVVAKVYELLEKGDGVPFGLLSRKVEVE